MLGRMHRHLVLMLRNPAFDNSLVGTRLHFPAGLRGRGCIELCGDACSGACLLRAPSPDGAVKVAQRDPLQPADGSRITVDEWSAP